MAYVTSISIGVRQETQAAKACVFLRKCMMDKFLELIFPRFDLFDDLLCWVSPYLR